MKEWFENKTIFVILALILIAVVGVAQFLKSSNTIIDSVKEITKEETPSTTTDAIENFPIQISGKIVDGENQPISNARVEVSELIGVTSSSDGFGNFILKTSVKKMPSDLELLISKDGYNTLVKKLVNNDFEDLNLGRIILQPIKKTPKKVIKRKSPTKSATTPPKQPTQQIENKGNDNDVIFENNTINGNIINNPSGTINIENNLSTPKDTTQND